MKKIFFAVIFTTLFALPAYAQHFEWAKSYTGPELQSNDIIGSFADETGNLYFLSRFTGNAGINGVSFASPLLNTTKYCMVLGKMSPTGELIWHKTLASSYIHNAPYGLAKVSDSTFMIAVKFRLPFNNGPANNQHDYVYYFDTLLMEDDGYLMPTDSIYSTMVTGFITFDLDGNRVEEHFLQMAYEDTFGHIIQEYIPGESYARIKTTEIILECFTVDKSGNIIIGRRADDQMFLICDTCPNGMQSYSVADGGIGALRIVVDGLPRHTWFPTHQSHSKNVQLLKFSPSFDTLLAATYVLDSTNAYADAIDSSYVSIFFNSIETDNSGNIFVDMVFRDYPSMPIGNSNVMRISANDMSYCLKYNPQLEPMRMYNIESKDYYSRYSHVSPDGELYRFIGPYWISYNRNIHIMSYRGDTLDLNNLAFWMRIDTSDGSLLAYGKVPSSLESLFNGLHKQFAFVNNRVLAQVKYWENIEAPGVDIELERGNWGLGLMQWDTEGHVLSFVDFDAHSSEDGAGQTHVVDSVVYMTGIVFNGATFGTTQVEPSDNGAAFIAKYVDTSLMYPYVYSDSRQPQYIEWEQDLTFPLSDTLIELTATATSGLPVGYSCDDTTVARVTDGVLRLLRVGTATLTATQNGSTYGYYPAAPVTRLLTIHQEGIDGAEPAACSVYPNPTHGDVYLYTADEPVVSVNLYTTDGRQLSVRMQGNSVSLAPYPAGVYYLQVTTPTNTSRHKVTKQ